jgi:predicted dehydrogenase
MNRPVRFGLVGAGGIAQTYAQVFQTLEDARLAAVADVRADAARAMAESASCPWFDTHEPLGEKGVVDAVLVCTPPSTHAAICEYFLAKRIPVLCEKPLSTDVATARSLVQLADKHGTLFTMASKFRYTDDVVRAKSIVTSGILGEIVLFENAFTSRVDMSSRWNSKAQLSGGGVLIDNGTHSVDIIRYFLGPIAEVMAVEGKRVQGLQVEDTARIFVRSQSGVMGSIDLSWSLNKEIDSYIDVYGSQGTVRVGWKQSKYRQSSSPDWIVFGNGYNKVQAMGSQIKNFAKALLGEEKLLITGADAIASVEVIESAYRSMRDSHWTPVAPNGSGPGASAKNQVAEPVRT